MLNKNIKLSKRRVKDSFKVRMVLSSSIITHQLVLQMREKKAQRYEVNLSRISEFVRTRTIKVF